MARRTTTHQLKTTTSRARNTGRNKRSQKSSNPVEAVSEMTRGSGDYRKIFNELSGMPAVRYIAGGIAGVLLVRLAMNLSGRGSDISNFIRENYDNLGDKFRDMKDNFRGESTDVRH